MLVFPPCLQAGAGAQRVVRQRRLSYLNLAPVAVWPEEREGHDDDDDMPSPCADATDPSMSTPSHNW